MLSTALFTRPCLSKSASRALALLSVLLLLSRAGLLHAENAAPGANLLPGDFETGTPSYNPWAGVDDAGKLRGWTGRQVAVSDTGWVGLQNFSPGVAVGDLNGDGLPDLVVADARGFFWYYPNSGRAGEPAFTQGEIMPIWLIAGTKPKGERAAGAKLRGENGRGAKAQNENSGDENSEGETPGEIPAVGDMVPRIQVLDYAGEGKLSLVVGNYAGQLYFFPNHGSATMPDFRMPSDPLSLLVSTHGEDLLWCNYLSPFLYNWGGTGRLDLIMGDGTYSANSIYLFTNQGANAHPLFDEKQRLKVVPGMGREQLTPQVVDWNNDGRADIITGERAGCIDVYLNQKKDNSYPPSFDPNQPIHVKFGTADRVPWTFPTVCVADLNGDKLFDLVLGSPDGGIYYCLNTGTPGAPKFGAPIPFKGVYPYKRITLPRNWQIFRDIPYGVPDQLLECVNAQSEPGLEPPPAQDLKGHGVMKFSVVVPQTKYFKDQYVPEPGKLPYFTKRTIEYFNSVYLDTDSEYTLSFWVRSEGTVSDFNWLVEGKNGTNSLVNEGLPIDVTNNWTRVSQVVELGEQNSPKEKRRRRAKTDKSGLYECHFRLNWNGDGTIYFDDMTLTKSQ